MSFSLSPRVSPRFSRRKVIEKERERDRKKAGWKKRGHGQPPLNYHENDARTDPGRSRGTIASLVIRGSLTWPRRLTESRENTVIVFFRENVSDHAPTTGHSFTVAAWLLDPVLRFCLVLLSLSLSLSLSSDFACPPGKTRNLLATVSCSSSRSILLPSRCFFVLELQDVPLIVV